MKTRNLLMMGMVAVAMMVGGCAETDNDMMETAPAVKDGQTVKIKVVDNGYGDITRAAESNEEEAQGENTIMQTNFIAGDKIGVFSISAGGAQHYRNLELRYDGTNWVNPDGETFYYFTGMRYFAYYPYNPDFDMSKVDWSQTTVDEFFAPYVAAWQPQADQSTTVKYMASDLMVGAGALSGETFTFSMGHTMGLVFVSVAEELNGTVYLFPKLTEAEAITNFDANTTKLFTFEQKVYKPSQKEGYYRYIVKPGKAQFISGMNPDGRIFSFTCDNVSAGHYKKFVVDGGFDPSKSTIEDFTVQLGDVYMSDDTFRHQKDDGTVWDKYGTPNPIGVIGYLAELNDEYTEGYVHGLILNRALSYAFSSSSSRQWTYSQYTAEMADNPSLANCVTVKDALEDKSGLTNSLAVKETEGFGSLYSGLDTERRSRWFMPTIGQWITVICQWGAEITSSMDKVGSVSFTYNSKLQPGVKSIKKDLKYLYAGIFLTTSNDSDHPANNQYLTCTSSEGGELGSSVWYINMKNDGVPSASTYSKTSSQGRIWFAAAF